MCAMHRRHRTSSPIGTCSVPGNFPWEILRTTAEDLCDEDEEALRLVHKIVRSRDMNALQSLGKSWSLQCMTDDYCGESRYLISSIVRKYPFEGDAGIRRDAALSKLDEAETSCSSFNREGWKALYVDGAPTQYLLDMQEFILRVIGSDPEDCYTTARHGPGADTNSHGRTSLYDKYSDWPYHVTRAAAGYAQVLIQQDERWLGALEDSYRRKYHIPMWAILNWEEFWSRVFVIKDTNRVTTVPKDGLTDRPIAIEPRLNLMLQLGVDGVIRRRLKRWGIDLDSQEKNQTLAREGSIRDDADSPVTLDLSNASDTVSLRCVKLLFSDRWFRLLVALRSPKGTLPSGERLRYSKLSSMGNGATFAVESLIFAAVAYAASKYTYGTWKRDLITVFGDDIIVPKACSPLAITLLETLGFQLNRGKCFTSGDRRESCGTDWIRGRDVRPVFIKDRPGCVADLICIRNKIQRWAMRHSKEIPTVNDYLLRLIPRKGQIYGPISDDVFDSWLHTPDMNVGKWNRVDHPWSWQFNAIQCLPAKRGNCSEFLFRKLMAQLRGGTAKDTLNLRSVNAKLTLAFIASGGSVFDVLDPKRTRYVLSTRVLPDWQTAYSK